MAVPGFAASSKDVPAVDFRFSDFPVTQRRIVLASNVGSSFLVKGKYIEFTVDAATFGVRDWTLTGAPNVLDINRRTADYCVHREDARSSRAFF